MLVFHTITCTHIASLHTFHLGLLHSHSFDLPTPPSRDVRKVVQSLQVHPNNVGLPNLHLT